MYAVNAKGRSEPFVIETVTFKGVAKYTGKFRDYNWIFFVGGNVREGGRKVGNLSATWQLTGIITGE